MNCQDKDQQNLSLINGSTICIQGGNCITLKSANKLVGFAGGAIAADGTNTYVFNSSVVRNAIGDYSVTFDSPHPNGANYNIALSKASDEPNEDQRKIQWLNKTANGFDVSTSVDDNSTNADPGADIDFDFTVFEEVVILTR